MSLFMATYCRGEICREIEYAIGLPMSYMILGLTNTTCIVSYAYIWRGINLLEELTTECRVGVVNYHDRHIVHHLIVIYP